MRGAKEFLEQEVVSDDEADEGGESGEGGGPAKAEGTAMVPVGNGNEDDDDDVSGEPGGESDSDGGFVRKRKGKGKAQTRKKKTTAAAVEDEDDDELSEGANSGSEPAVVGQKRKHRSTAAPRERGGGLAPKPRATSDAATKAANDAARDATVLNTHVNLAIKAVREALTGLGAWLKKVARVLPTPADVGEGAALGGMAEPGATGAALHPTAAAQVLVRIAPGGRPDVLGLPAPLPAIVLDDAARIAAFLADPTPATLATLGPRLAVLASIARGLANMGNTCPDGGDGPAQRLVRPGPHLP
jgi:hypothetical protein